MSIHRGVYNNKCKYCEKGFIRPAGLKVHIRSSHKEKMAEAGLTEKDFANIHTVAYKDVPRKHPCDKCDKAFKKAAHLRKGHIVITTRYFYTQNNSTK